MPIMSSCLWLRSGVLLAIKIVATVINHSFMSGITRSLVGTHISEDNQDVAEPFLFFKLNLDQLMQEHMEFFRAFCEGDCDSSVSLVSLEDRVDFVPDFFSQHPYFLEHEELSLPPFTVGNSHQATGCVAGINDYWLHSLDTSSTDVHWNKPESSLCSNDNNSVLISGSLLEEEEEYLNGCMQAPTENNLSVITRDGIVGEGSFFPEWSEVILDATACVDEDVGYRRFENHDESDEGLPLKRKFHDEEVEKRVDRKSSTNSCDNLKKRTKISRDGQHDSKTVKSKKGQKHEGKAVSDGQSCSSSSSEEEIAFRENNGQPTLESITSGVTVCGKIRASRGSATDPQSVYAKKRREKINERLRILQTLVPNGTKVDISTMLEEAVEYVKFLQLQIQLLSSDDLWMYAPLAYNGFDIGLHQKMSLFQ